VGAALGLLLGPERGALALLLGTGLAAVPALFLTLRGRGRTPLPLGSFLLGAALLTAVTSG
jgi:prepilin signal peptidase PulO-like enzyme (type II secretory pathway)